MLLCPSSGDFGSPWVPLRGWVPSVGQSEEAAALVAGADLMLLAT